MASRGIRKKIRVFTLYRGKQGDLMSGIRGEARETGKPKPLKKKEREQKRKKKKLARLEKQRSR